MTSPIPAWKPVRTGSEMNLATNPRRKNEARIRIPPVRAQSVALAAISPSMSPSWQSHAELRAQKDRQCRGGAYIQHPRCAEQGIEDHRNKGGIERSSHRQSHNGRICHRFRQHDGRGGQACDEIRAYPGIAPACRLVGASKWHFISP